MRKSDINAMKKRLDRIYNELGDLHSKYYRDSGPGVSSFIKMMSLFMRAYTDFLFIFNALKEASPVDAVAYENFAEKCKKHLSMTKGDMRNFIKDK